MPRSFRILALALAVLAASSGCSSDGESAAALVDPTIDEILTASSAAMAEVETARFEIAQTGAPVFIDNDSLIRFVGAKGRYAAPESADALVSVEALGLATEVGAVAIDGEIWITNPLTGAWEVAPEGFSFDPTILFDDQQGWSVLLAEGLDDPSLVANSPDAEGRYEISATISAGRVGVLTGGLVEESSDVTLWIDGKTARISEVSFDVTIDEGLTSWNLELSDYGADVSIEKPVVVTSN